MRFFSQSFRFASRFQKVYNAFMNGVFIIFSLISALRRGIPAASLWRLFHSMQFSTAKTSFWLSVCTRANLLNQHLHPTAFFHEWLAWQADAQILHLIQAWKGAPRNRQERLLRKRLLLRLVHERPLRPSDFRLLVGLDALGVTHTGKLTLLAKAALGLQPFPSPVSSQSWWIEGQKLHIPHNPNWLLLWRLEGFLKPTAPFTYSLDEKGLRLARQNGPAETLIEIFEAGLGKTLPGDLRAGILGQPSLRLSTVTVIEFSSPAELRQLRRSQTLRQHLDQLLSPRHALVSVDKTADVLKLLQRRGIYTPEQNAEAPPKVKKRTHFPQTALLEPLGKPVPLRNFILQAIDRQGAFEMRYHAPEAKRPEIHHITPLLVEERNGYTYIIAYSHNRHAQRTYRLDRMDVPGTVNAR
jgi:hypothetical protein